jgi:peptidoglycan hydrolase CwlO-like protein
MRTEEAMVELMRIEAGMLEEVATVETRLAKAEARLETVTAALTDAEQQLKARSWEISEARQQAIRDHDQVILQKQNEIRALNAQIAGLEQKLA